MLQRFVVLFKKNETVRRPLESDHLQVLLPPFEMQTHIEKVGGVYCLLINISCPGHRVYPWERYLSSIFPPSARGVKQGCRLCTHAFKIMHGRKRTWMTKRKSRGPETDRSCRHAQTPRRRNVAAYGRANWKRSHTCFLLGTGRTLQASKNSPQAWCM